MIKKMPILFIGHGSPMNALAANSYTEILHQLGKDLPIPSAILCISAHWTTNSSYVTHMVKPKTIHDFYGFPQALFNIQYNAPGSPSVAELLHAQIASIQLDESSWGLDHGTWSVLLHLYPEAKIPVLQLSIDIEQPPEFHFSLGKQIQFLREQGVLIIGSGNIVHNLGKLDWEEKATPHRWAQDFDAWAKEKIESRDFHSLIHSYGSTEAGRLSVPTAEHYYPLLYILGAATAADKLKTIYEGIQNASISMRSIQFG
jgi:4,5-DOPA dioxygenase extradiol